MMVHSKVVLASWRSEGRGTPPAGGRGPRSLDMGVPYTKGKHVQRSYWGCRVHL